MYTIILLLVAILPPIGFLLYLLAADRKEPEPLKLILFAIALGAASTIPASIIESVIGLFPLFAMEGLFGAAVKSFIQVAPVEEACKLAVVLLFIWKNKNFNEENDGIVYVTASAIGFAMFENVLYVFMYGFATGIGRAITAIPLHTFCGVIMGIFLGRARFAESRKAASFEIWKGFLLAVLVHGLYDTFAMAGTAIGILIIPLVIVLFIIGVKVIRHGKTMSIARWDNPSDAPQMLIDTPSQLILQKIRKYGEEKIGVDEDGRHFLKAEKQGWKAVTGNIMLAASAFFIISAAILLTMAESAETVFAIIAFTIMITCVPLLLGFGLKRSYRYRMNTNYYFD